MDKITTKDCVEFIVNHFKNESTVYTTPKNWKRTKKIGSGEIIRIFENKVNGVLVNVFSTETEISRIMLVPKINFIGKSEIPSRCVFSINTPKDIVIMGSIYGNRSDVQITDDYSYFSISINQDIIINNIESDGFVTVLDLKDFIKEFKQFGAGGDGSMDSMNIDDCGVEFYYIENFVGDINLNISVDDNNKQLYIDPNDIDDEFILWDKTIKQYNQANIILDIVHDVELIKIDQELFNKLFKNV